MKKEARAGEQMGLVVRKFSIRTPSRATRSQVGVSTGGPAQDSERVQALIVADQKDDVGSGGGAHGLVWLWEEARLRCGHGTGNDRKGDIIGCRLR